MGSPLPWNASISWTLFAVRQPSLAAYAGPFQVYDIQNPRADQRCVLQVFLLPSFTDEQRAALLAACTAVLYTPQNEHFGIVPLEAMASGRPVIACDSGGPTESVQHGITGFLCKPSPDAFAHAMRMLLVGGPALPIDAHPRRQTLLAE